MEVKLKHEGGKDGGGQLGKKLEMFNMLTSDDIYNCNCRTGTGPGVMVCCYFISNHSGLMAWCHMQHMWKRVKGARLALVGQPQ